MIHYGTLRVDWNTRRLTLNGLGGEGSPPVSHLEALQFTGASTDQVEQLAVVYYEDQNQLALYSTDLLLSEATSTEDVDAIDLHVEHWLKSHAHQRGSDDHNEVLELQDHLRQEDLTSLDPEVLLKVLREVLWETPTAGTE